MRSIKVLPESVRSSMRSGVILFDLTRVVEELVFNSLDARAAKVIVAVGVGTNYIRVTDNGCGITRDGLVLLGERYATSKFEQLAGMSTGFGFRGEALSSISDVSVLEVVTKAHGMPNGYRKVIKGCKCLYLGIDDDRQDVGTTVVVRDLFYNQPVKRRHLQSSPKKVLHSVKECILRIALVHLETCFKVIDIESGDELLSLYPSSSPVPLLTSGFGIEVSRSLHKLDESDGLLKLSGYVSAPYETFSVKVQYFYINSRYISRGPIHKLLNELAAMHSGSDLLKGDSRSQCGKRNRCQASPIYILNLICLRAHYDLSLESGKTCVEFKHWDPVLTFIKKAVSCFWTQGAHMSEVDDIWNGADTLSTRDGKSDDLNNYRLPKKRCTKLRHQDSIALSSPQLEIPREEPNYTAYGRYSCNRSQTNVVQSEDYGYISSEDIFLETNKHMDHLLVEKKPSAVSFHFNDDVANIDDDLTKPFLRSCSSRVNVSPVDDRFRFQADTFKKWLNDDVSVWSPPRITTLKESCDSVLTVGDCLTEDSSHWIQYSKSSHRSSKRHFEYYRDDGFDFSVYEEPETDIFNFDNMRDKTSSWEDWSFLEDHLSCKKNIDDGILFPQRCDSLYETGWTRSPVAASRHMSSLDQCRSRDKQRRRSCSAPPFYRGKKKYCALNSWTNVNPGKSHHETINNAPTLQEAIHPKHMPKSSGVAHLAREEGSGNDLQYKARHDKKKVIDKAEISDCEAEAARCFDVDNTNSDFISENNEGGLDFVGKWRNGCPSTSSIPKPDNLVNQDSILDISSGILHLSRDSLLPKSVTKKCLENCKVLQQVDKKFIPVVGGGILTIIDQHAADERIRLEDLREKVLSGEMKTITYLDGEQELVLPEIGYQLLNNYSEQIQKWGWICNFHAQSSESFKKNLNFLHNQPSVPTLKAVPCILGVNLTDVDLLEYLQQLADTDGSSSIPQAVLQVLNFKACRGAIMFGDALLPSECSLIVEELKQTSLCFQCAHGRPTTAPLVNLVNLHKQIAKLGNWSHGSSGQWHGLSRHRPSLERAAQRLSSEGGQ